MGSKPPFVVDGSKIRNGPFLAIQTAVVWRIVWGVTSFRLAMRAALATFFPAHSKT